MADEEDRIRRLTILRETVDWENKAERLKFITDFCHSLKDCTDRPAILRVVFRPGEIERLLADAATEKSESGSLRGTFIRLVAWSDYRVQRRDDDDDDDGNDRATPLHLLARLARESDHGSHDFAARMLFKIYGTAFNHSDEFGCTHFHAACKLGLVEIVEKFLDLGQDANVLARETGDAPLHLALATGKKEVARLLLRRGADPRLANKGGSTPLHVICARSEDCDDLIDAFLRCSERLDEPVLIDARDESGDTPLHLALANDNKDGVEALVLWGADPNLANNNGETPLHVCCKADYDHGSAQSFFRIARAVRREVRLDVEDNSGRTPLQWAVANLFPHVVEALLDNGADLANFVFPSADYFGKTLKPWRDEWRHNHKLIIASCSLACVEHLRARGYRMERDDCWTILQYFAEHRVYEKPPAMVDLERAWHEDEKFAAAARGITMIQEPDGGRLSLLDFVRLPLEEASGRVAYEDYFRFVCANELRWLARGAREACIARLCEIISRRFLLRWARDRLWELTGGRPTIDCCEPIVERLTNEDLRNIGLAAAGVGRSS
uniref:Uncharacterized protein n=1 Tax=Trichogramma kaykai TaxID=54128 RepID=A0ABD2WK59_9HYME